MLQIVHLYNSILSPLSTCTLGQVKEFHEINFKNITIETKFHKAFSSICPIIKYNICIWHRIASDFYWIFFIFQSVNIMTSFSLNEVAKKSRLASYKFFQFNQFYVLTIIITRTLDVESSSEIEIANKSETKNHCFSILFV